MTHARSFILAALALGAAFPALVQATECKNPFQYTGTVQLPARYSGSVGEFTVPSGQRLHIQHVSAGIRLANANGIAAFAIGTWANRTFAWHPLPVLSGYGPADRQTTMAVTLYADPGTLVKVEINRGSETASATTGRFSVTGCLYPVSGFRLSDEMLRPVEALRGTRVAPEVLEGQRPTR